MSHMPRMRIASGVFDIIKEQDPDTAVSLSFIRRLIITEQVPVVHVGHKKLVDADKVIEFIAAGGEIPCVNHNVGVLRKVAP